MPEWGQAWTPASPRAHPCRGRGGARTPASPRAHGLDAGTKMRPRPSAACSHPLTPTHPAHTPAHTTCPTHPNTPPHPSVCSRGGQPGRLAQPGGGAGPLPAEGPTVCSGLWGGPWGGEAAAAPGAAAPAGGLRHAAQGPGRPRHQHQGERSAGPGSAGVVDAGVSPGSTPAPGSGLPLSPDTCLSTHLGPHASPGQERLVHVGAAGSEDRRPQTQELRTATVLRPLNHSKAFM